MIPREERHKLDARCDLLVSDALAALDAFNGAPSAAQWRPLAQREQLTFYRAVAPAITSPPHDPDAREQSLRFLATGYFTGSLAQVTSGLYSDTTRDLTLQQCVLLADDITASSTSSSHNGNGALAPGSASDRRSSIANTSSSDASPLSAACTSSFINASVLYVGEQEHRRAPFRFAGIKWFAWRTQSNGSGASGSVDRDLLAYERSGAVSFDSEDSSTNSSSGEASDEVMYHVIQSIERPPRGMDAAKFPPGLRHTKFSVCYLYRQVCDDLVECFAIGEYPALRRGVSSVLQRIEDVAVADRVLTVARALAAYSAKKLSRLIEKNRKLPVIMSKSCLRCSTRRTVFDPLRTCGICKKSVCQSCRNERTIFKLNIDTNRPETETFCRKCLVRSKLPDAAPVALEKIKQQQLRRRNSSDRSRYSSHSQSRVSDAEHHHDLHPHHRRSSAASRGSSGSRDSTDASSAQPASNQANSVGGFNYDALFRHYAVEKPVVTRSRASTLPDASTRSTEPVRSTDLDNNSNSNSCSASARAQDIVAARQRADQGDGIAADAELLCGEEVELGSESLRGTQLGLPVILVGIKSLRETQLGVPVEIETGRVSEPQMYTTSQATFFAQDSDGSRDTKSSVRATQLSSSSDNQSSLSSPTRRSDLYLDLPTADGGNSSGVERLYQTYLERKEKLETVAADAQQLRNTRLEVSRQHQQSRRSPTLITSHTYERSAAHSSASTDSRHEPPVNGDVAASDALKRRSQSRPRRSDVLPTKQHFHMDLYAQM